jgi:hypothetical protein
LQTACQFKPLSVTAKVQNARFIGKLTNSAGRHGGS